MARARIKERRARGAKAKGGHHLVKLDRPGGGVVLLQGKAHGDPHPKELRGLETTPVVVEEIAVVQRLQAQVRKGAVSFGAERPAQRLQVEAGQLRREPLDGDPVADVTYEKIRI